MAETTSMPLSVLLAICTELNNYHPSQMAAARMNVDLDVRFVEMLEELARKVPFGETQDWILNELNYVEPSAEPE
jgi:hypothetical protein